MRTLLAESGVPKPLWGEAITFAAHMMNCVHYNEQAGKSPFEMITGRKPYMNLIKPFATKCCVYNRDPVKKKLDERGYPGVIVGIDEDGLA